MENEENNTKSIPESNIIHINTYVLTKQINQLLKTLNPQIKSSNLNAHFHQLIQTLITQTEFVEFDLQIKMKNICLELAKCISNSKVTIFFLEPIERNVLHFVAPSIHKTIKNFYFQYNQTDKKISAPYEYKIRVSNISKDSRWAPYYHHFAKLNITSCWTIPIYKTAHIVCAFAIYTNTYKNPISKELNCIQTQNHHLNKLICEYPADFTSCWKGIVTTD